MNLFDKDPDATYRAYQKFRKRNDYEKAYRCIETLLKQFPDDMDLLDEIVGLALYKIKDPSLARPWLMRRIKLASYWRDYAVLGEVEAATGSLKKAKDHLIVAAKLQKRQRFLPDSPREVKQALDRVRGLIRLQEHNQWVQRLASRGKNRPPAQDNGVQTNPHAPALSNAAQGTRKARSGEAEAHGAAPSSVIPPATSYRVSMRVAPLDVQATSAMLQSHSTLRECQLRVEYAHLNVQRGFDDLLCLNEIKGVERYWYQVETAKKVLKYFHGRALLCDEVGLGKTVEAGIMMKEYLMRGMVKSILILTPAPLVSQWQEEMAQKFGIDFTTTEDPLFDADPDRFWRGSFIIASIHTAKSSKNFPRVAGNFYDLVVVDEAHHLKKRNTLNWKLVNEIQGDQRQGPEGGSL